MAEKTEKKKNRDGSSIGSNEYVTLALCVIVPIIGLLFALYYKQEREPWANRAIVIGVVALLVWIGLILVL